MKNISIFMAGDMFVEYTSGTGIVLHQSIRDLVSSLREKTKGIEHSIDRKVTLETITHMGHELITQGLSDKQMQEFYRLKATGT